MSPDEKKLLRSVQQMRFMVMFDFRQ